MRSYVVMSLTLSSLLLYGLGGGVGQADDQKPAESTAEFQTTSAKDKAPMIVIPAGKFSMGADDGRGNERPVHEVQLPAYAIDQFEVTMKLYDAFLQATGQTPPPLWDPEAVNAAGDRPAVGLTWNDAQAYCKWAGKRLPSEAEWEKAARGEDARRFPWGHMQPFVDIANYNRGVWVSYPITLVNVKSGVKGMSIRHGLKTGGKSPYGLYHMAGNAAEWVADWYDRTYYQQSPKEAPKGPKKGDKRVIRGGSWSDTPVGIRSTARVSAEPTYQDQTLGVRCAMDVTP